MPGQYRSYHTAYMILAISVIVPVMCVNESTAQSVFAALGLFPPAVRQGEIWRLITYAWLPAGVGGWGIARTLLYRFLTYFWFAAALETLWGTRRFLTFYFICVLGGGVAGFLANLDFFFAGGIPEVTAFLIFGLIFSDRQIMLLPLPMPIPVRLVAIVLTAAYVLGAIGDKLRGLPCLAGLACGLIYFFSTSRLIRPAQRIRRAAARKRSEPVNLMGGVPKEQLMKRARMIVERRRDEHVITPEERMFIEELIQRIDPGKEHCAPYAEEPSMCPECRELGICLRAFLEKRRDLTP